MIVRRRRSDGTEAPRSSRVVVVALSLAVSLSFSWSAAPGAIAADEDSRPPGGAESSSVDVRPGVEGSRAAAAEIVARMSTRERASAIIMAHLPTTDPTAAAEFMARTGVGGFILMGANVGGTEEDVRALTDALTVDAALPPLIAIDEEGGEVRRLPWDDLPSALTLKGADPAAAGDAFSARGSLVARAGANLNFGVVADWTDDPGSFIYGRAWGASPEAAASRVEEAVRGEQPFAGTTLKHFPGHGAAPGDSHHMIPRSDMSSEAWRGTEAVPFVRGIAGGAGFVMFGHLAYTEVDAAPASLSTRWHRVLREDLGFEGVVVTDDMGMLEASGVREYADPAANAVAAVRAGNDLILGVSYSAIDRVDEVVTAIESAVDAGEISPERLEDAATRVVAARLDGGAPRAAMPCPACQPAG